MTLKNYTLKVTLPEYWQEIHDTLCGVSSCQHIPDREVSCYDEKLHSPTRGTFILHNSEAENLKNHPYIDWIELDPNSYPDLYPKPEPATKRFKENVKIYRDLEYNLPPISNPTSEENRRTNWAIKRVGIKTNGDFWNDVVGNLPTKNGDVSYTLTGKNVDIVIHDSGILQYHPEFLDSKGQSRVKDIVLDGPYYIDPVYFDNTIPGVKYTKPDGRVGIATTAAEEWWENGEKRSSQFADIGTIPIPATYTASRSMGDRLDGTNSLTSQHGTACAGLAAGKYMGLAFEANIWNMPAISDNVVMGVQSSYDLIKLFHKYKPVNPQLGVKNPTIVNGSWAYQAAFRSSSSVGYKFRGFTGNFTGNATGPSDILSMKEGLLNQVSGAYKSWSTSSRSSSTDTAANEMMAEGVIYVAAAGNNNQRLGIGANDPDRLNYMEDVWFSSGDPRPEFGGIKCPCNHRDWMNPQGIGFDSANDFHPVICVGAMDDFVNSNYSERKAYYSNNGPGIDVWAPADELISSGILGNYQRYDDSRFYDAYFNGTSAAAPVATGLIALYLETNPKATSKDVKTWLKEKGSILVGSNLYQDEFTNDTINSYWIGQYNMRGAEKRILYNPYASDTNASISGVNITGISFSQS